MNQERGALSEEHRPSGSLQGIRVVEMADEQAEYCGLLLAGLGADVIKVEPIGGNSTRRIGPFLDDLPDAERSLYFWHYNRGKRSIQLDLDHLEDQALLRSLIGSADVLLDSTPRTFLGELGFADDQLRATSPSLITARISPFGDTGPWRDWQGSDLIHLALGGPVMNCGYDPQPDGTYDLPPIAPQMWQSYHITGELMAMMIVAALIERQSSGSGQHLSCAVHEAVAKSTEMDLMSWIMRAVPFLRQTCRHASDEVTEIPTIAYTKDGRWIITPVTKPDVARTVEFLDSFGVGADLRLHLEETKRTDTGANQPGRAIPGSGSSSEVTVRCQDSLQRLFSKFIYDQAPWLQAQAAGLLTSPLRRPHESAVDPHWLARGTCRDVSHPEFGRAFTYPVSKWISDVNPWQAGRRAPLIGEDTQSVRDEVQQETMRTVQMRTPPEPRQHRSWILDGVRIFDFSWFLATAGGTRFLASLGAEVIKVEWKDHPDTRLGAMAPVGGRAARESATGPLPPVSDPDMGGQFLNKNPGKRGISLNVKDPRGLEIAKRLIAISDVVAEGFSPGVLDRWGLGYDVLRSLRPDIIYAQQSGMGSHGIYGRFRSVGPIAAAFTGIAEMSGLPEPFMPAGWGYSYLDWIGAYSFGLAIVSALHHRNATGEGQWIDASQCEAGIFASGTTILDWSANGREWRRYGNHSPHKTASPHGIYRCEGLDAWIALACFDDRQWQGLCSVARRPEWLRDPLMRSMDERLRHQDHVDRAVELWTSDHDRYDLMESLQAVGIPAGVCQTAADRCDRDPQLQHLDWLSEVHGSKIGTWPIPEVPVKFSATPARVAGQIGRGAPCYGEDNDYVFGELLGMSSSEIEQLRSDNII